jgi:hypothetical protein
MQKQIKIVIKIENRELINMTHTNKYDTHKHTQNGEKKFHKFQINYPHFFFIMLFRKKNSC